MPSNALRDFIVLLYHLAEETTGYVMMHGRCPDCWTMLSGHNPLELIGDILGHICLKHSEDARETAQSGQ